MKWIDVSNGCGGHRGEYDWTAEINANDLPHVVVEKLEKAMLAAAPTPEET